MLMTIMSESNRKKADQFICVVCVDKVPVNRVAFTNGCNHPYHEQCLIEMTHPKSDGCFYEEYSKVEKKEKWICPACKSPFNRMKALASDLQSEDDFHCPRCVLQDNFANSVTIEGCNHKFCTNCITPYLSKASKGKRRKFSICPKCKQQAELFARKYHLILPKVRTKEPRIQDLLYQPIERNHERKKIVGRKCYYQRRQRPKTIKTRPIRNLLEKELQKPSYLKNISSFKEQRSGSVSSCSDSSKKLRDP